MCIIFGFLIDDDRSEVPFEHLRIANEYHRDLTLQYKLNGKEITLELITLIQIVQILVNINHDYDVYTNLPVPKYICEQIINEYHYQNDLYFTLVIEPDIDYT